MGLATARHHHPGPIAPLLVAAFAGALSTACDPGPTCEVHPDVTVPDGLDVCTTTPAMAAGDAGRDTTSDAPGADAPNDSGDTGTDTGTDTDDAYPDGPYGTSEGATIANLAFETSDGSAFELGDAFRDPDVRLVLVSTAAGWCTACREEQPALVELHDDFADDGLLVLVALFEDDFSSPATREYGDLWDRQYGLPFPLLVDSRNRFGAYYDSDLAPMNMFIDGQTMEILFVGIGFDEGVARALVADRL